ncbi:TPR-like protein [Violaceomyces palustris]|uniref:TPR-like protein n=1 Tax=Violaceomyces palustris TaxID=1673888 RepID=A0ACD0NT38_9BASI|nr:TPR-like protein [Violaceomyces palustris]
MASTSSASSDTDVNAAIQWLAEQRKRPIRKSFEIVQRGELVIEKGGLNKLGDELWSFLEQVGMAAMDLGKWELAELCTSRLHSRFPDSARVACLQGMLMEAHGEPSKALEYYESELAKDETSIVLSKRLISVIRSLPRSHPKGGPEKAIDALVKHLDTFYNDPEGWQELAEIYAELGMYNQSIFALEELMLLTPQNSFYVLQYAETLYTAGEVDKAYKAYLRVLEMCGEVTKSQLRSKSKHQKTQVEALEQDGPGPWLRALWGLKLCTTHLLSSKPSTSTSKEEIRAEKVESIDELVTKLLLQTAYSPDLDASTKDLRDSVRNVLSVSST